MEYTLEWDKKKHAEAYIQGVKTMCIYGNFIEFTIPAQNMIT